MNSFLLIILAVGYLVVLHSSEVHGFVHLPTRHGRFPPPSSASADHGAARDAHSLLGAGHRIMRLMAGFGSSASKKPKKETKLKPKAQWDRYTDLKGEPMIRVAVRVNDNKEADEEQWLEVGRVRSKDNAYTEVAVARQRAIIADHARRLFPLQVSTKDKIDWAFWEGDDDEGSWTVVEKSVVEGSPEGIEKKIGFEGRPDPATGFYCKYDGGRLLDDSKTKKLQ